MEQTADKYDVIIVGLGCVGCSAAYYCTKKGLKVLGLEMNSKSGEIGTSSYGYTRIYRDTDANPLKNDMMTHSFSMWREVQQELESIKQNATNSEEANLEPELLTPDDLLVYGKPDDGFILGMKENDPSAEWITGKQISQKYPAFKNIPEDYIGNITKNDNVGQIRAERALNGFSFLARRYGADLRYNSEVAQVFKDHVILADKTVFNADSVVVCCGANTTEHFESEKDNAEMTPVESIIVGGDNSDMPGVFLEAVNGNILIYGLRDGPQLEEYKLGIHTRSDFKKTMKWIRERLPSKIKDIKYSKP